MYQRILVPIDGSATSNLALQEASKLAKQHSTQVELVYVMTDIHLMDANSYINYDEMKESLERTGRRILTEAQTLMQQAGVAAEVKLLEAGGERIAGVILEEARRWSAELIVIGTHGRSGFSRVLFGSVAEGIVRMAHIPVLLIRGDKSQLRETERRT
ncbi:universal stress protein [Nitrosospira multiformis]|uniref:Universal stress protein n=1 Tax=Nitrosospira multiformis TaxID=1231 RepID=A0A1I7G4N9_9PROT|nr:universal stress protein [Nitrosospira multiformis]SFU43398.1 Nucleotide-binding universal stress protein, UspA family [Nitrosospira multiformis]